MPEAFVVEVTPPSAPVPATRVQSTIAFATGAPNRSSTRTVSGCAAGVPTAPCCASPDATRSDAAGALVAVSVAVTAVSDGDEPSNWYEPDVGPSTRVVLARPVASVTAVAVVTLAPPVIARNVTGTPETGPLSDACTSTTNGCGSVVPAGPVWLLPLITTRRDATGTSVMRAVPVTPSGVIALTVTVPRRPALVTIAEVLPLWATVASDPSLEVQRTRKSGTLAPAALVAVAMSGNVPAPEMLDAAGVSTTALTPVPGPVY